jgi:hypothetical protein
MGLWTVVVMPDGVLVPPLPRPLVSLTQLIVQWRKERERDEMVQNLIQSHHHIIGILHVRVSYMFNLSNSI